MYPAMSTLYFKIFLLKLFLRLRRNFARNKILFFLETRVKLLSHDLYGKIYV